LTNVNRVSRHDLYNSESEDVSDTESSPIILPNFEFDIIENNDQDVEMREVNKNEGEGGEDQGDEDQQDFDFPLFSMGNIERGRSETKTNTIRVTLRSPSPEIINQERPKSYYFAEYNDEMKKQFKYSAITYDDVIKSSNQISYGPIGKIINLKEYNDKISKELTKNSRKSRPGKKARLAKIKSRENNKQRDKIQKEIEEKQKAKLLKKMHHKRGGKKHKKKKATDESSVVQQKQGAGGEKPKYRTE